MTSQQKASLRTELKTALLPSKVKLQPQTEPNQPEKPPKIIMKQAALPQPGKPKLAQLSPSKYEDQKLSSKRKTAHYLNKSADLSGISLIQMLNRRNQSTVLGDRLTTGDSLAASKRIRIDFKKDQVFQNIHRPNKQLAAIKALDYTTLLSPK